jgi:predicted nucleotidyltransferase
MTDSWIKKFQKEALPILIKEFKPEKLLVFGSRVRGNAKRNSDIDVIIVSSYFESIPFLKRMPIALKKVPFPKHVDYICYTQEEYGRMKNESSVIMDALENALELTV